MTPCHRTQRINDHIGRLKVLIPILFLVVVTGCSADSDEPTASISDSSIDATAQADDEEADPGEGEGEDEVESDQSTDDETADENDEDEAVESAGTDEPVEFLQLWQDGIVAAGFPEAAPFDPPITIAPGSDGSVTVAHQFGETLIPAEPDRVISDLFNVEELIAIGLEPAGYTTFPNREVPESVATLAPDMVVIESVDGLNYEQIALLEPDLIVQFVFDQETYELLSEIAPTVPLEFSIYGYLDGRLRIMGQLFDRPTETEAAIAEYIDRVAGARDQAQSIFGDESVSNLIFFGPEAFVYGPRLQQGEDVIANLDMSWLYDELGLTPGPFVADQLGNGSGNLEFGQVQVSRELVTELQADHLVVFPNGYTELEGLPDDYTDFINTALWATLPAVEADNVYPLTGQVSPRGYFTRLAMIEGFVEAAGADG
ncbi:MAG: ABC transporter substrate-binding protein [Actinomycetota bacterium]